MAFSLVSLFFRGTFHWRILLFLAFLLAVLAILVLFVAALAANYEGSEPFVSSIVILSSLAIAHIYVEACLICCISHWTELRILHLSVPLSRPSPFSCLLTFATMWAGFLIPQSYLRKPIVKHIHNVPLSQASGPPSTVIFYTWLGLQFIATLYWGISIWYAMIFCIEEHTRYPWARLRRRRDGGTTLERPAAPRAPDGQRGSRDAEQQPQSSLAAAAFTFGPSATQNFERLLRAQVDTYSEDLRARYMGSQTLAHRLAFSYLYIVADEDDAASLHERLSALLRHFPEAAEQQDARGDTLLHLCSGRYGTQWRPFVNIDYVWRRLNLAVWKIDFEARAVHLAQAVLNVREDVLRVKNKEGYTPLENAEHAKRRKYAIAVPRVVALLAQKDERRVMHAGSQSGAVAVAALIKPRRQLLALPTTLPSH